MINLGISAYALAAKIPLDTFLGAGACFFAAMLDVPPPSPAHLSRGLCLIPDALMDFLDSICI